MKLKYYRQLEVYEFAKDLVLCEMEIVPRKIYYFHGQQSGYRTYRWMQPENWAEFEYELERFLLKRAGVNQNFSKITDNFEAQFDLQSSIVVNIKKVNTTEYKEPVEKNHENKHCALVIKCKFEFKERRYSSKNKASTERDKRENLSNKSLEKHKETSEKIENKNKETTEHAAIPLSANDNVKESTKNEMKLVKKTSEKCASLNAAAVTSKKDIKIVNVLDTESSGNFSNKEEQFRFKENKKSMENEGHVNRKKKKLYYAKGEHMSKKKEDSVTNNFNGDGTNQSPVKKRRLHSFENERNTLGKWLSQKEVSVEIIDSDLESQQKLDKFQKFSIIEEVKKSEKQMKENQIKFQAKTEKDSYKKVTEKRESKRLHESKLLQNERITSPVLPPLYKYLTLDDLSSEDLTCSLTQYKTVLDDIFRESKTESMVHSYNELDHYLVISLIDQKKQMDMMNKLSDVYQCDNASLIANALLPEWLIRLFMQRYEVTRTDAIAQIKSQETTRIHSASSHPHKDSDPDLSLKQRLT